MGTATDLGEFHRAYDRITDAFVALDKDWRYTHVNRKAGELLGRDPRSLLGKNMWAELPAVDDQLLRPAYEQAMREQRAISFEAYSAPFGRWFENRAYGSPDGLTIYSQDITERKRAEQLEVGQRAIMSGIAQRQPLIKSLAQIAMLHEELNPGALCSVLLVGADRKHLRHGAAPSLPAAFNEAIDGQLIGDGQGSCGTAISRRERVVVTDIATHPYWEEFKEVALEHGLLACWSVPVLGSWGQVLGSFAVYYREPRTPGEAELESIDMMLPITAIAIESEQLAARMRERDYFFDLSTEIYCIFDIDAQRIVQVNPSFCLATGYSAEELTACHYLEFVHPDDRDVATGAVEVLDSAGKRVSQIEYRFLCRDGSHRTFAWESIVGPDGLAFAVANDVTARREAEAALQYADTHDLVTNLPHRRWLEDTLVSMLDKERTVWVLMLGIDRFHAVNESMGHVIGDDVLRRVADRLSLVVDQSGHIARFAGDQFVIAMPDLDEDSSQALAQRLRDAVARDLEGSAYRLALTASIGISHSPTHGRLPQDLLRRAEAALAQAKRQGRDGVCMFSARQMQDIEERLMLGHRLRGAVERGETTLNYQPLHSTDSGALCGFEALLRWTDDEHGSISPARFIPIAEALGLMPEIGKWVVNEACRQGRAWLDAGHDRFAISVNISVQELQRPGLVEHVGAALARHALPPAMLIIEMTESSLMENVERVRGTLAELKALGTGLALDDFGTGYSSLAYLKQFPIDTLKIDQSFVRGLPGDADDAAIARTIVAMAHQLRMRVAAEGVETDAQAAFLNGIGCDEVQGYLFGRPLSAIDAEAVLAGSALRQA